MAKPFVKRGPWRAPPTAAFQACMDSMLLKPSSLHAKDTPRGRGLLAHLLLHCLASPLALHCSALHCIALPRQLGKATKKQSRKNFPRRALCLFFVLWFLGSFTKLTVQTFSPHLPLFFSIASSFSTLLPLELLRRVSGARQQGRQRLARADAGNEPLNVGGGRQPPPQNHRVVAHVGQLRRALDGANPACVYE